MSREARRPKLELLELDGIPTNMARTVERDAGGRGRAVVTITCPCGWTTEHDPGALRFHYAHCAEAQ